MVKKLTAKLLLLIRQLEGHFMKIRADHHIMIDRPDEMSDEEAEAFVAEWIDAFANAHKEAIEQTVVDDRKAMRKLTQKLHRWYVRASRSTNITVLEHEVRAVDVETNTILAIIDLPDNSFSLYW